MTAFKRAVTIILGSIAVLIACVVNAAFIYFGFAVVVVFGACDWILIDRSDRCPVDLYGGPASACRVSKNSSGFS
jgi:hypothetical protein